MPLLFAAQQAAEGVLWLSLTNQHYVFLKGKATYFFLFFAEMLWPVYMPLIATLAEGAGRRRKLLGLSVALGLLMTLQLAYGMRVWPTEASLRDGHILYNVQYPPANTLYYGLLYFIATTLPLLLSRHRSFRLLGVGLIISYSASRIFYNHYIISIWCYFAAFLSIIAVAIIYRLRAEDAATAADNIPIAGWSQ
jgi:hypothetical protein